jgi:hypothetical protein
LPRSNVNTTPTGSWTEHVDAGGNTARNIVESITIATASTESSTTRTFGTNRDFFTIALALLPQVIQPQGDGDSEGELASASVETGQVANVEGDGDSEGELASITIFDNGVRDPWGDGDSEGELASVNIQSMIAAEGDGGSEGELADVQIGLPRLRVCAIVSALVKALHGVSAANYPRLQSSVTRPIGLAVATNQHTAHVCLLLFDGQKTQDRTSRQTVFNQTRLTATRG